ncbi:MULTISPECIES: ATP-binding protein [Giesbergeria]|uniref:histidine kinase n=1 Tax=Giesbergeria sinuosa TaxID=80883 RepID=A0ABV9QDQ3_9BURK
MSAPQTTMPPAPRSLQRRLLSTVLALVATAWGLAAIMTWYDARHEVSELLDAHLVQTAALLLMQPLDELEDEDLNLAPDLHKYQQRVVFQVWHKGKLLAHSANAPREPLTQRKTRGFADSQADGESWHVFVTPGHDTDLLLQVGELQSTRNDVVMVSLYSMIWPTVLMLPLLVLGIWWTVHGSVRPLRQLGQAVAARQPQSLEPLATAGVPPEVLPLVTALNGLFDRTTELLTAEQQFTANAAHELRTPIAGIRMQAQVAQGAMQDTERAQALAATVQGCDRATRLVEQLLQLARLDAESASSATAHCDLADIARALAADLHPSAQARQQQIVLDIPPSVPAPLAEPLARVLLRNLLDNALRYTPDGAQVYLHLHTATTQGASIQLCVEDSGPGMTQAAIDRLGERFFRVLGTGQSGSGLGWSIVQRIARLHGLEVQIDRSPQWGGLRVRVHWP